MMNYQKAAASIQKLSGPNLPDVGVVLGSGLGQIANSIKSAADVSYNELPGFPMTTVSGHEGRLRIGTWGGAQVACLQGRFHFYEGHELHDLVMPIRALRFAGCETLILTCAAGSLTEDIRPGTLALITDHINWAGISPLIGPNDEQTGSRFVDVSRAYDPTLQDMVKGVAKDIGVPLHEGVYLWSLGPNFETPAEIRAFRALGADLVGMSIVPECLAAVHCGLRVLAIAVVTNLAAGMQSDVSHRETLAEASRVTPNLGLLLESLMKRLTLD